MSACAMLSYNNVTDAAWQTIKAAVQQQYGITIGDNTGSASSFGFTVHWNYVPGTQVLTIQCTDSPFFVSCSTINSNINQQVENALNQHSVVMTHMGQP